MLKHIDLYTSPALIQYGIQNLHKKCIYLVHTLKVVAGTKSWTIYLPQAPDGSLAVTFHCSNRESLTPIVFCCHTESSSHMHPSLKVFLLVHPSPMVILLLLKAPRLVGTQRLGNHYQGKTESTWLRRWLRPFRDLDDFCRFLGAVYSLLLVWIKNTYFTYGRTYLYKMHLCLF